ncbi:MAG: hypothetical protein A2664_01925 [Candidatus Taylorbacteria bacterium RIFCSPHIGHO2_01_FULL_46_22b]|uniref:Uncharacterized protein n=1 Tax=Candidatus Taylorbacteria bacterium RIFCSPHIGHO2_01_FULL_46_22b TaxID=1802301 RepID=A0A1G2M2S8_9BACT|nr:MAG: hypothetical protein A2664_01925 [Candidatus Taylorbacteria bacterium RIFCSPHIGHO2_01_FULL_46_22b]
MAKQRIYLTDIMCHVRNHHQTGSFAKATKKGRMYSPLPENYAKTDVDPVNHTFKFRFQLPSDLVDLIKRGEAELVMPKDGLFIFAGPDTQEMVKKMGRKERRQLIHRSRTWHADKKE